MLVISEGVTTLTSGLPPVKSLHKTFTTVGVSVTVIGAPSALAADAKKAKGKAAKEDFFYQEEPGEKGKRCETCVNFEPTVGDKGSCALLEGEARVGEWVLVHVGFALDRIDEEQAAETLQLLSDMGEAYERELEQIRKTAEGAK